MRALSLFAVGFVLFACGGQPPPPTQPPPAALDTSRVRTTCPFGITSSHAVYDETSTGAKITFDTTPERLTELRARVNQASALHGTGKHRGPGHDGRHGVGGGKHGLKPIYLPPVDVGFEETPTGARLVFTPKNEADLDKLRATLKLRAEKMMTACETP